MGINFLGLQVLDFNMFMFGVIMLSWLNGMGVIEFDGMIIFEFCFIGIVVGIVSLFFGGVLSV